MKEGMQEPEKGERRFRFLWSVEKTEMTVFRRRLPGQDRRDAGRGIAELRANRKPYGKVLRHEPVALDDFVSERIAEHKNLNMSLQGMISREQENGYNNLA